MHMVCVTSFCDERDTLIAGNYGTRIFFLRHTERGREREYGGREGGREERIRDIGKREL